jgi:mRNA interferase MazF
MNPTQWLVSQGDVFWYDFGQADGSEPGGQRPVVVIQGDSYNHSAWGTTVVAAITTRLERAELPGMVFVAQGTAGLVRDSVVNLTSLATVDKYRLVERLGTMPRHTWLQIEHGFDEVLDRMR